MAAVLVAAMLLSASAAIFYLAFPHLRALIPLATSVSDATSTLPGYGSETVPKPSEVPGEKDALLPTTPQQPVGDKQVTPPASQEETSRPSSAATPLSQLERTLLDVLERYEAIRIRSHGPTYDVTGLDSVLAEGSLKSHLSAVQWQQDNNAYYQITVHENQLEEITILDANRAKVLVNKLESRVFYINGKVGPKNTVYNDRYHVRYHFRRIGGSWYIVDREVIPSE